MTVAKVKETPSRSPYTWAQSVRDIFVTAINKGQLPLLGVIAMLLLLIFRMPEQHLGDVATEVVASLKHGELWVYLLEALTVFAWYVHAKSMRKTFSEEAERIGREKTRIQSRAAGVTFKSSNQAVGNRDQRGSKG